jgi:hypothetical protein
MHSKGINSAFRWLLKGANTPDPGVSHLLITKAEKADLQDQLEIMLKDEPEKGDHDYYISAAMILRAGLQKGHKCADEPWE